MWDPDKIFTIVSNEFKHIEIIYSLIHLEYIQQDNDKWFLGWLRNQNKECLLN